MCCAGYDEMKSVCFGETLGLFVGDSDAEAGHMKVSITDTRREDIDEDCVIIQSSVDGVVDNVPCGLTVMTFVSSAGTLLEHHQTEFVQVKTTTCSALDELLIF